jgi:hypothetical protein
MQDAIRISRAGHVLCRMAKPTPADLPGRQLPWESEPIRDIQKKMAPWHAFKRCVLDKSAEPSGKTATYGTRANPAVTALWVVGIIGNQKCHDPAYRYGRFFRFGGTA